MKYMPVLLKPYHKIIILAYEGENYNLVNEQITLFFTYSFEKEGRLIDYLKEVYEFIGVPKDGLFRDYYERRKKRTVQFVNDVGSYNEYKDRDREAGLLDRIKNIVQIDNQYNRYVEYEEELSKIEDVITQLDMEQEKDEKYKTHPCYELSLRKINESRLVKKLLPASKSFIYLEKIDGNVREGPPRDLKPGYYIIMLDDDERKTLLDLIIEIFDLEKSIDKYLIKVWKEKLIEYIETHNLSYNRFYQLYRREGGKRSYQTVLNWIKGNVLSPEDRTDLLIIGKILKSKEITENYQLIEREANKLRNIHRLIGRKLRKIIKEVLKGEIDPYKLGYEEYAIYKKIENGVYEIIDIKINNFDEEE